MGWFILEHCKLKMVSGHFIDFLTGSGVYLYINPWREEKAIAPNRGCISYVCYCICLGKTSSADLELLPLMQLSYRRSSGNAISDYLHASPEILQGGIGSSEVKVEDFWAKTETEQVLVLLIVGLCTVILTVLIVFLQEMAEVRHSAHNRHRERGLDRPCHIPGHIPLWSWGYRSCSCTCKRWWASCKAAFVTNNYV